MLNLNVCVCVCVCARARARACVRVCACVYKHSLLKFKKIRQVYKNICLSHDRFIKDRFNESVYPI